MFMHGSLYIQPRLYIVKKSLRQRQSGAAMQIIFILFAALLLSAAADNEALGSPKGHGESCTKQLKITALTNRQAS